jgi:hypothetical protein
MDVGIMEVSALGRTLVIVGLVVLAIGLALVFADRLPLIGRLPGDMTVRGDGWTVYVPIATSILLSVVLSVVLGLVTWFGTRR